MAPRMCVILLYFGLICDAAPQYQPKNDRNICGEYRGISVCCEGWTHSLDGTCTTAICEGNCGEHGRCIRPNQCLCANKSIRPNCMDDDTDEWMADEPIRCPNNCNGHGNCVSGRCVCEYGYEGSACEVEVKGPCFTTVRRGTCQNPLYVSGNKSLEITKAVCCGSVGAAWGKSCKICSRSHCGQGFITDGQRCIDIDECSLPGICQGGICKNTKGSFVCECPYGYYYNADTLKCSRTQNACEKQKDACKPGGICVPEDNGAYRCHCGEGYIAVDKGRKCQLKVSALNYCEIFKGLLCKNGECVPNRLSYECRCNSGYSPSSDRRQCLVDVDICSRYKTNLCKNGQCIPVGRYFQCKCDRGYILAETGTACLDRCQQLGASACGNGICIPKPFADYECVCLAGYEPTYDKRACRPAIQNAQDRESSWSKRRPVSVIQSDYARTGFANDPRSERPTGRLETNSIFNTCDDPAVRRRCLGGRCVNEESGKYRCECLPGYSAIQGGQRCVRNFRKRRIYRAYG
ncbi:hypothetical protein SprV_0200736800 [Sparganum proliferum]